MAYTIKQVSEKTGITSHTIRYYDREGLLPLVERTSGNIRNFSDEDIQWLNLICCLRNSGMPVHQIKEFMDLCLQGEKTCEERRTILLEHRKRILAQLQMLNTSLDIINFKIDHYKEIGIFHIDQ